MLYFRIRPSIWKRRAVSVLRGPFCLTKGGRKGTIMHHYDKQKLFFLKSCVWPICVHFVLQNPNVFISSKNGNCLSSIMYLRKSFCQFPSLVAWCCFRPYPNSLDLFYNNFFNATSLVVFYIFLLSVSLNVVVVTAGITKCITYTATLYFSISSPPNKMQIINISTSKFVHIPSAKVTIFGWVCGVLKKKLFFMCASACVDNG